MRLSLVCVVLLSLGIHGRAAVPEALEEIYGLLRSNLVGVSETELNAAAIEGWVRQLEPRVLLTGASAATHPAPSYPFKATVFDESIAYLRLPQVNQGADAQFRRALQELGRTNKLKGVLIDLRFATGDDYHAAAAIADVFLPEARTLLTTDGEGEPYRSTAKTNAVELPVAVLANGHTAGAAEALTGILRYGDIGLVLGAPTAGAAYLYRDFPLRDGRTLRIANRTIEFPEGEKLSRHGVQPDIKVEVAEPEERAYLEDPFKPATAPLSGTNSLASTNQPRRRMNEAELVRILREGTEPPPAEAAVTAHTQSLERPLVQDPVLGRGLDLLKGIAVMQQQLRKR